MSIEGLLSKPAAPLGGIEETGNAGAQDVPCVCKCSVLRSRACESPVWLLSLWQQLREMNLAPGAVRPIAGMRSSMCTFTVLTPPNGVPIRPVEALKLKMVPLGVCRTKTIK